MAQEYESPVAEIEPPGEDAPDEAVDERTDAERQIESLTQLGLNLEKRRMEAVNARVASGIERRWREDEDLYHGRDTSSVLEVGGISISNGLAAGVRSQSSSAPRRQVRSTVFVQLTRQKTNTAAARFSDILYPTDDRNWSIQPTPVPELSEAVQTASNVAYLDEQTGGTLPHPTENRPVTLGDAAADTMAQADKKAERMQAEIDDQLLECDYNHEGRMAIQDAATLGTGILKGPIVHTKLQKTWSKQQTADGKSVYTVEIREETKPQSHRVSPWNFYPDPSCGEDIHAGAYVWERDFVSAAKLRELAKLGEAQGYFRSEILKVLRESPAHNIPDGRPAYQGEGQYRLPGDFNDQRYELWTYTGEINRDDLEGIGIEIPDEFDELTSISAVVVLCNCCVLKAILNPLDTGGFPYDLFNWETVSSSPWGAGIPFLMRTAQTTINAAWRALLDNMSVSYGPQIVLNRGAVTPADGQWDLTGRKIWWADPSDQNDVTKAFNVFTIPSQQQELAAIIELAMRFADEETALPMIAQGEQGTAPETLGGMQILMNSHNTVLRRLVKRFDDKITRPHIRRYYDWNMQYSDKEEIKGDYEIDARGSTAMMVRDSQAQAITNLMAAAVNPVFGIYIDPKKLFIRALEAQHFTPSDVMRSPQEIEQIQQKQAQQPQQLPVPVQVAQMRGQAEIEKMKIDTESERQNQQLRMQESAAARQADKEMLELQERLEMLKYANQQQTTLAQIRADLTKTLITVTAKGQSEDRRAQQKARQQPPTRQ